MLVGWKQRWGSCKCNGENVLLWFISTKKNVSKIIIHIIPVFVSSMAVERSGLLHNGQLFTKKYTSSREFEKQSIRTSSKEVKLSTELIITINIELYKYILITTRQYDIIDYYSSSKIGALTHSLHQIYKWCNLQLIVCLHIYLKI